VNSFILESFKEFPRVHFYTVRWDEYEESETDRFIARFMDNGEFQEELEEILTLIEEIGENRGAKGYLFNRFEDKATALPPNFSLTIDNVEFLFPQNRLRLYCVRLSEQIVILFNGGLKESQTVQDSPDLIMKFREAQLFVKKIEEALREKDIEIDEKSKSIRSEYGEEIIIY
jgi:hypothetical protein